MRNRRHGNTTSLEQALPLTRRAARVVTRRRTRDATVTGRWMVETQCGADQPLHWVRRNARWWGSPVHGFLAQCGTRVLPLLWRQRRALRTRPRCPMCSRLSRPGRQVEH